VIDSRKGDPAATEAAQKCVQGIKDGAAWIVPSAPPIIFNISRFGFGIDEWAKQP